ncbi:MAG TPA: PAS domain-containing protein, partial [Ilumatobacteraceae bacterium]|nr:PAS domain-containing protein [Ilumatobacteraceae bacterium]
KPIFALRRPDGTEVMVEADVRTPITNPDRIVATLRDITSRLRETEELARAQVRFGLAFRSAPTGMLLATTDDEVVIDVNDALAAMLGYSRAEIIGRQTRALIHRTP